MVRLSLIIHKFDLVWYRVTKSQQCITDLKHNRKRISNLVICSFNFQESLSLCSGNSTGWGYCIVPHCWDQGSSSSIVNLHEFLNDIVIHPWRDQRERVRPIFVFFILMIYIPRPSPQYFIPYCSVWLARLSVYYDSNIFKTQHTRIF